MDCATNVVAEQPVARPPSNKKNQLKVPKKIHKAEREKLKRDQLNDLFLELGNALEPSRQNNGKASILGDATRILRDLILQVQSLRKQNVALTKESYYVTVEKDELKDETVALESDITRLSNELKEKQTTLPAAAHTNQSDIQLSQSAPNPFFIGTYGQNPQILPTAPAIEVKRPHARYPTPDDSWPQKILSGNSANVSTD